MFGRDELAVGSVILLQKVRCTIRMVLEAIALCDFERKVLISDSLMERCQYFRLPLGAAIST